MSIISLLPTQADYSAQIAALDARDNSLETAVSQAISLATSANQTNATQNTTINSLSNRVTDLEFRPSIVPTGLVAFSTEGNLTTQLNSAHPSGGLMREWVLEVEGNAIDITLGSATTAATLKTELGVPSTDTLIRVKSGLTDTIISNATLIPNGLYRLWYAGGQVRIRVLDSSA